MIKVVLLEMATPEVENVSAQVADTPAATTGVESAGAGTVLSSQVNDILIAVLVLLLVLLGFLVLYRIPRCLVRWVERGMQSRSRQVMMAAMTLLILGVLVSAFYQSLVFWAIIIVTGILAYVAVAG